MVISVFSLAGWLFLVIYMGFGLIALPYSLIEIFVSRPQRMSPSDQAYFKRQLEKEIKLKLATAKELKGNQILQVRQKNRDCYEQRIFHKTLVNLQS